MMIAAEKPEAAPAQLAVDGWVRIAPDRPPVPPWMGGSPRLWSLEDMTKFPFMTFNAVVSTLQKEVRDAQHDPTGAPRDLASRVSDAECQRIAGLVAWARDECHAIGLLRKSFAFSLLIDRLRKGMSFETLHAQLVDLTGNLLLELSAQRFAFIPAARAEYFENNTLFGRAVYKAFPSARADIKNAGNCLAAGDLDTAAVFHLMRVVEHGLRGLARKLRVALTHKGKRQPINDATWDKIIAGCKKRIDSAHALSPGPKRKRKLALYSDAAERCLAMKDLWRNNVSHTGPPYSPEEALAVMGRVRDFMVALARVLAD